jgi:hypothetical protein
MHNRTFRRWLAAIEGIICQACWSLLAAKCGPGVRFCMPNRTRCTLLVSVKGLLLSPLCRPPKHPQAQHSVEALLEHTRGRCCSCLPGLPAKGL